MAESNSENNQNSSSSPSSVPSPAKLRAEARKQKILSKGNDRLAKITGAMKGRQQDFVNNQSNDVSTPIESSSIPEPPDVDISKIDNPPKSSSSSSSSSTTTTSTLKNRKKPQSNGSNYQSLTNSNDLNRSLGQDQGGGGNDDPIFEMMRSMGLGNLQNQTSNTNNNSRPPPVGNPFMNGGGGGFGNNNNFQNNPLIQQAFGNGPRGGLNLEESMVMVEKSLFERLYPLINIIIVSGLMISSMVWWDPISKYLNGIYGDRGLGSEVIRDDDESINVKDEWDAIHPQGSSTVVRKALGPIPVFWMFVTIELGLQATRWMFSRNNLRPPGLMNTLIMSLPRPYSDLAFTILRYFSIFNSLLDDLCLLVFGVGVTIVWLEFRNLPESLNMLKVLISPPHPSQ